MNLLKKLKFASAASKLVDSLEGLPFHGSTATLVVAGSLVLSQWITKYGDLFGEEAKPYLAVALTITGGLYSISALAERAPGGEDASAWKAMASQVLLVAASVLAAFVPIAPAQYQSLIADMLPVIQAMQASKWLREQSV